MGVEVTGIELKAGRHGDNIFVPGDTLTGTVELNIKGKKPHKLSAVYVKVRGKALTKWNKSNGSTTTVYRANEQLLRIEIPLIEVSRGQQTTLPVGKHRFDFSCTLPDRLAHTQKVPVGNKFPLGRVKYLCKARAVNIGFWSRDGKKKLKFTVLPHRDLNQEPQLAEQLTVEKKAKISRFGGDLGQLSATLKRQGFVAGEVIDVWLNGPDQLFRKLAESNAEVKLKRKDILRAGSHFKSKTHDLVKLRPGRDSNAWRHLQFTVPADQISQDPDLCSIIIVSHYIKSASSVTVKCLRQIAGIHLQVTLGTIPLRLQNTYWNATATAETSAGDLGRPWP